MIQVGIVVALPEELQALTQYRIDSGQWKRLSDQLLVAVSGTGSTQAAIAANNLVDQGARALVSWGCAGALDGRLRPGHLVVPKKIVAANHDRYLSDLRWRQNISCALSMKFDAVNSGRLFQSSEIVSTTSEKNTLARIYQAVAVDMESAAVAKVAKKNNYPFVAIRAIADPLKLSLPRAVSYSLDESGNVCFARLFKYLFSHPWEILPLACLGYYFSRARKTLRQVAKILIQSEFSIDKQSDLLAIK